MQFHNCRRKPDQKPALGLDPQLTTGLVENSFGAESFLSFHCRNYAWTGINFAQRTTERLALPDPLTSTYGSMPFSLV
jgi:hypothetical protein